MKNIPRKCPICKGKLAWVGPSLECWELQCFEALVKEGNIYSWKAIITIDGFHEWGISSSVATDDVDIATYTELEDQDGNIVLTIPEWHPFRSKNFLKNTTVLLERLLKLKAFF